MKKLGLALACVCIGTLLAQSAGMALLWSKGNLNRITVAKLLAVLYGIEPKPVAVAGDAGSSKADREQPSWDQIEQARILKMRQIEMREQTLAAEAQRLRTLQSSLEQEKGGFDRVRSAFETRLQTEREGAVAIGRDSVRTLWETMKPKQAKEQILQRYESGDVDEVVRIIAAMSPNKQAKIAAEFKTPDEAKVLSEITAAILEGKPQTEAIDETQAALSPPTGGPP
jgi:flagellar motility protein MotE (MotC chaperone)